jgi:hypothetical protein
MSEPLQRTVAIITAECLPNATIEEVAYSMCDLAAQTSCYVKFVYEGVEMLVSFHHTDVRLRRNGERRKKVVAKS